MKSMRSSIFSALFMALTPAVGPRPAYHDLFINVNRRKKGGGVGRSRSVRSSNRGEAHLYGNKLARKAHRRTMTIKCARL